MASNSSMLYVGDSNTVHNYSVSTNEYGIVNPFANFATTSQPEITALAISQSETLLALFDNANSYVQVFNFSTNTLRNVMYMPSTTAVMFNNDDSILYFYADTYVYQYYLSRHQYNNLCGGSGKKLTCYQFNKYLNCDLYGLN